MYRDLSNIGPDHMPVCNNYWQAASQYEQVNRKRQETIKDSEKRLTVWVRSQETARLVQESDTEQEEQRRKENEYEVRISSAFRFDHVERCLNM